MKKYPQQSMRLLRSDGASSNQAMAKEKTPGSDLLRSSTSSALVAKRKVDEVFRRLQPHSLVQSTERLLATLRIVPQLMVNGEELLPNAPAAPTVAVAASVGRKQLPPTTAGSGRFRYGLSLQYISTDPELTLVSLKDVKVMLTSTAMHTPRCLPLSSGRGLSSKSWRLVAETDRRVGLALYELALGDWQASSLIALVWAQNHEVARFFLQLHTTELLYSAPSRTLNVRRDDDLDRAHGLHSYTAAISLRSLDELFWEREIYHIEFLTPETGKRSVTTKLLDNAHGGSVATRDRMLTSEVEPAFKLDTEAVKYSMNNCILVDFTLWDADCIPVWGFSRLLELTAPSFQQHTEDNTGIDISVSSLGGAMTQQQMRYQDTARENELVIRMMKLVPSGKPQQSTKKNKTWVSQIDLTLSLGFVNNTFGTKY